MNRESLLLFVDEGSDEIHLKYKKHDRGVVPGGAPPRSVNPISTRGGRLCPTNKTDTPGFSDLPMAL